MSLRVWLPLNGTLENQGCSEIAVTNHNATVDNSGKIGKCYLLNGTNAYINGTYNATQEISFCCWANFPSIKSAHLFDARTSGGTGYQPMYVTASSIQIGASGSNYANFSQSFSNNTWYHICVTHSATEGKCYINGNLIGTSTAAKGVNMGTCAFTLGSRCNQSNYQNAKINDVRIYDHCLSAAEVHEISQGLVLHYKLDSFQGGYGNPNLCKNSRTFGTGWSGSGAITQNAFNGFAVKYKDNTSGTSYTDIAVYNSVLTVNPNEVYTVSFWAKADTAHNITCYFYNNNSGVVQSANSIASTGASGTATDGATTIALTTEWKYYWITWTFKNTGTAAAKHLLLGRNAKAQSGVSIAMVKLERGASATPWSPHPDDGEAITASIQDSSGYGHNGTIINTLSLVTSQARYSSNIHFSANNQHIQLPVITYSNFGNSFTIAWWGKRSTHSNMMFWGFSDGNRLNGMYNGTLWNTGDGSNNPIYKPGTTTTITAPTATSWHHYVMVGNGTKSQLYVDGILYGEAKTYKGLTGTSIWINGWRNHTEYSSVDMDISDFRIYCTALSADDILSLYHTAAKVDNLGGLHTFELNENGSNKLTKTGIFKDYMVEPFITLSDGSKWQMLMFHYVDGGNNLFTSSNAAYCNNFGLYSRLQYIDNFTYNGKYEFYAIQDGTPHRWTQTNAPLTTTSVANFTVISGSPGGGICKCNGNTLLARTNTTSNWWDACGCWTKYSTGIPGFNGDCKYYLALYARISEPKFHIANLSVYANNLIER